MAPVKSATRRTGIDDDDDRQLSKILRWPTDQTGELIRQDAALLIASFGDGAYDVARTRAREVRLRKVIDDNRPAGHWHKVRLEIARMTGKDIGTDAASRYPGV